VEFRRQRIGEHRRVGGRVRLGRSLGLDPDRTDGRIRAGCDEAQPQPPVSALRNVDGQRKIGDFAALVGFVEDDVLGRLPADDAKRRRRRGYVGLGESGRSEDSRRESEPPP
jgi:hypothetical protein